MTDLLTCQTCGATLQRSGHGRPRAYCSPACRRQRENERRQWDRLQRWAAAWERHAAQQHNPCWAAHALKQAERLRAEAGPERP